MQAAISRTHISILETEKMLLQDNLKKNISIYKRNISTHKNLDETAGISLDA